MSADSNRIKEDTVASDIVVDALRGVRATIERGWCQGAPARDAQGVDVCPDDPSACEWCFEGAISLLPFHQQLVASDALNVLVQRDGDYMNYVNWQDAVGRTKPEVLVLIDRAIEEADDGE